MRVSTILLQSILLALALCLVSSAAPIPERSFRPRIAKRALLLAREAASAEDLQARDHSSDADKNAEQDSSNSIELTQLQPGPARSRALSASSRRSSSTSTGSRASSPDAQPSDPESSTNAGSKGKEPVNSALPGFLASTASSRSRASSSSSGQSRTPSNNKDTKGHPSNAGSKGKGPKQGSPLDSSRPSSSPDRGRPRTISSNHGRANGPNSRQSSVSSVQSTDSHTSSLSSDSGHGSRDSSVSSTVSRASSTSSASSLNSHSSSTSHASARFVPPPMPEMPPLDHSIKSKSKRLETRQKLHHDQIKTWQLQVQTHMSIHDHAKKEAQEEEDRAAKTEEDARKKQREKIDQERKDQEWEWKEKDEGRKELDDARKHIQDLRQDLQDGVDAKKNVEYFKHNKEFRVNYAEMVRNSKGQLEAAKGQLVLGKVRNDQTDKQIAETARHNKKTEEQSDWNNERQQKHNDGIRNLQGRQTWIQLAGAIGVYANAAVNAGLQGARIFGGHYGPLG